MATITITSDMIIDHLENHQDDDIVQLVSFNWDKHSRRPEIEYEFKSGNLPEIEYDDDDYVDAEEFNELTHEHNVLKQQLEQLQVEYNELQVAHNNLLSTIQSPKRSFWKFWS